MVRFLQIVDIVENCAKCTNVVANNYEFYVIHLQLVLCNVL